MKYTLASSAKQKSNCKRGYVHSFKRINDVQKKKLIKRQFRRMKSIIWECEHCKHITETT